MSYATENTCSPPRSEVRLSSQADPGERVQVTKQQLLVPVTTAVQLRDFSTSLKVISKKRLFLVKLLSPLPVGKREKNPGGIRKHFSGGYKTEVSSLCQHGTLYFQTRAHVDFLSFCAPHHPSSTQEQNQSSSVTSFGFIFVAPFSVHPRKESSHSGDSF